MSTRLPWRRCPACGGICHWHEDHWVCDGRVGCGAEWQVEHDPKFEAPGGAG